MREEDREEGEDGDFEGGRDGRGDRGVGKSIVASSIVASSDIAPSGIAVSSLAAVPAATSIEIVATSSVFETGFPQERQKRAALDNCVPQDAH